MKKPERNALLSIFATVIVAAGCAWAGSQGGYVFKGVPIFAGTVVLIFLIQWLAFIPAYLYKTEKFYDLVGSLTYIFVTVLAVLLSHDIGWRSLLLLVLVIIWAGRLGTYLFIRILSAGKDARFDDLKMSFLRFLNAWTLQGLWVNLTLAAVLAAITATFRKELGVLALIGLILWLFGFTIEAVADAQKSRFRSDPENKGRFIQSGLWAWSRHPNYFGEIVLWTGIAIIALPVLQGWQLLTLISPVFVTVLLTKISGVPILEKRADEKWDGDKEYQIYKKRTPVLIPWPSLDD